MAMTLSKKPISSLRKSPNTATPEQATGIDESFEILFNRYWERLCMVLYRLVGDQAEAEDLALEAFMRLYHQSHRQFDNPGGWLYRVATNLGLNALRSRKRQQHYEERGGEIEIHHRAEADPSVQVEKAQEREAVRRTLAKLKPRLSQALILRYSGLSYAEIAAALQVAPSSVGTLLARAEREFERTYVKKEVRDASQ
jgi:RNA polymerase sigma-70 factor (ECF subfamily)